MGRGLGRDGEALGACGADGCHGAGCRDVLDVQGAAGLAAEADVARHGFGFCLGREDGQVVAVCERAVADHAVLCEGRHDGVIHHRFP